MARAFEPEVGVPDNIVGREKAKEELERQAEAFAFRKRCEIQNVFGTPVMDDDVQMSKQRGSSWIWLPVTEYDKLARWTGTVLSIVRTPYGTMMTLGLPSAGCGAMASKAEAEAWNVYCEKILGPGQRLPGEFEGRRAPAFWWGRTDAMISGRFGKCDESDQHWVQFYTRGTPIHEAIMAGEFESQVTVVGRVERLEYCQIYDCSSRSEVNRSMVITVTPSVLEQRARPEQ